MCYVRVIKDAQVKHVFSIDHSGAHTWESCQELGNCFEKAVEPHTSFGRAIGKPKGRARCFCCGSNLAAFSHAYSI